MPRLLLLALPLVLAACAGSTAQPLAPAPPAPAAPSPEASGATGRAAVATRGAAGTQRALLVAINTYNPPGVRSQRRISDLAGPLNDLRLMRAVLLERGIAAANIDTLTEGDATREGIERAVTAWIGRARPGDHLTFFFAGHGSYVDTLWTGPDGETEARLETIVPADAASGVSDIADKTLRMWWNQALDAVQADGAAGTLTVVQDNCHSGTGSRGEIRERKADQATSVLLPDPAAVGPRPDARGALFLSASRDYQPAVETDLPGEFFGGESGVHGAFTASLVRALRATAPGAPARDVFDRAMAHVEALGMAQVGVLEGPGTRPPFGETPTPGGGALVTVAAVEGGQVVLRGGLFAGLGDGAELIRTATTDDTGRPLTDSSVALRVATADATRSRADVTRGRASQVQVGDRFRVTRFVPPPGTPLRLWLAADADALRANARDGFAAPLAPEALRSALATRLERVAATAGLALTDNPAVADYWLVASDAGGVRWVRAREAASGDTLAALPDVDATFPATDAGADALATAARRLAEVHRWAVAMEPPPGSQAAFPLEVLGLQRVSDGLVLRPDASGAVVFPQAERPCYTVSDPRYDPADCYRIAIGLTPEGRAAYDANPERQRRRFAYATSIGPSGDACLLVPFAGCRSSQDVADFRLNLRDADALALAPTTAGDSVWVADLREQSIPFTFRSETGRNTVVLLTTNEEFEGEATRLQWDPITEGLAIKSRNFDEPVGAYPTWGLHRLHIDVVPRSAASGDRD